MRRAVVIVAVVSALLAGAWYGLHFVPTDSIYVVEAEFSEVPPDDRELDAWVQAQPGVWRAWAERRPDGPRTRVVVTVGMTRDGWGRPPFPDLEGKCVELGYRGPAGPFRDQER